MSYGVGGTGVVPEAGTTVAPVPGTRIYLKRSDTQGKKPTAGDAEYGELFVNYHSNSPMLCFKDNANTIVEIRPLTALELELGELTDVDTTGQTAGMVLSYNGSTWVPVSAASIAIDVDLGYTPAADKGTVTNTAGDDATIPLANGTSAGLTLNNYTTAEKDKLAGVEDGAEANVVTSVHGRTGDVVAAEGDYSLGQMSDVDTTDAADGKLLKYQGGSWVAGSPSAVKVDLGYTPAADKGTVTNDAGTDAVIPFATSAEAGLFQEAPTPDSGSVQYAREVDDAGAASWAPVEIPPGTIVNDGTRLPDSPEDGQLWYDTVNKILMVWDGTEWVPSVDDEYFDSRYVEVAGDEMTGDLKLPNLEATGDIVAAGDIQSTSQNGGPLAGFRNQIINGDFRVNQRSGNRTPGVGVYGFDRWKGHAGGLEQVVEALPAEKFTLSWVGGGNGTFGGTTAVSPITATVTPGNTSVVVPSNATNVQLEPGPVATPFEHRPIGTELALCQRYYYTTGNIRLVPSRQITSTNTELSGEAQWMHPVTMRSAPTHNLDAASIVNGNFTSSSTTDQWARIKANASSTAAAYVKENRTFDAEL